MADLKISGRHADQPVVRTSGMLFCDGNILEPVLTGGDPERLQLARWDGSRATIAPQFEFRGKLYQPAALDLTILRVLYLPTHAATAEPARQLLADIGRVVTTHTSIPERCVTLVTRFVLATWFALNFWTAPWLSIVGPDVGAGMQLLRLLRCFCHRALPIFDPSISGICALPRDWHFTFLIQQTKLSGQAQVILHAACRRGGYIPRQGHLLDIYAPCVTLTNDPCSPSDGALQAIEIPTIPDLSDPKWLTAEAERQIAAEFQPRMLGYFFANNCAALPSGMDVAALSFSMREVARNLAACTPNDESLQAETVEALKVQDDATRVTRWTDDDTVLIESLLSSCHDGEEEAYIGKIAKTAEDILTARGDQKKLKAKAAGTRLRLMQFKPEPRDRKGFRVKFTDDARRLMHRLAYAYDVPAVQDGIARCEHCRPATIRSMPSREQA